MENETRFDLTRHPEKKGQMLERQDNPEKKIDLPYEGLVQAQAEAVKFAEEFSQAPEGTVFWGMTSNAPRTQEARFIFDMELGVLAKELGNAVIVDLEQKMPDEKTAQIVKENQDKKIILVNGPVHPGMGIHNYNMEEFMKVIDEMGSEAKVVSEWKDNPEIAKRIGVEYDEVSEDYKKMLDDIAAAKKDLFPDRELWVKGFGHSAEIEVGLATYADKEAGEVIEEAGGMIKTMESAKIIIKSDGSKTIEYRGKKINEKA